MEEYGINQLIDYLKDIALARSKPKPFFQSKDNVYVQDSSFPSVLTSVANRLDKFCTVKWKEKYIVTVAKLCFPAGVLAF